MKLTGMDSKPTIDQIRQTADRLRPHLLETPLLPWCGQELLPRLSADTEVLVKLELFQHSGTFKARGALANMLALSPDKLQRGVTTVSAGNHAIAVAYAARALGSNARVVMQNNASPARVAAARALGADVVMAEPGPPAFARAEAIAQTEGRSLIHPFEGPGVALGSGTLGLEMMQQARSQSTALDAVIVAIGGGGLAGGVSTAVKQLQPDCQVFGVEPEGADTMHRSFAAGSPQTIDRIDTIADSLAPPMALPYSYGLCRDHIDHLIKVSDDAICRAMGLMFRDLKLAVEPGGAAAVAALVESLAPRLRGRRVGVICCGSNIDMDSFTRLIARGEATREDNGD